LLFTPGIFLGAVSIEEGLILPAGDIRTKWIFKDLHYPNLISRAPNRVRFVELDFSWSII